MTQQNSTFRILVATDNHLGFKENHHIRADDSYDAFEEILSIAKENKVDFVLLGGDLFHEVTPSQGCLYRSMNIFKKYIFGPGDLNFTTKGMKNPYEPNYLNENLNIDLPVFIIHGNHDYPATAGKNVSSLDLLQASHLVNYIGKTPNLDEVTVEPILFEKGSTKIALYGLGHIKDTRLHYLLEKKKVNFIKSPSDEYMNILIIHQNRFKGIRVGAPYKSCVHPAMLPEFMDLIIWGNEHECVDELVQDPVLNFFIYQPGSSIATSLNQGEALAKHIGLFEIHQKKNFKFVPIPLKNQRPLYVKSVELEELMGRNFLKKHGSSGNAFLGIEQLIENKLEEEVLKLIEHNLTFAKGEKKLQPLIRLKVEYTGFDIIRVKQLEQKFVGKVANEGEIFKFWRKQTPKKLQDHRMNEKLNEKFEECLKQKISFDTLASDSTAVISDLFEDLMKNSVQKPKVLMNYNLFTQASGQKFTFQNLANQISESLSFANGALLSKKIQDLSKVSSTITGLQQEYIKNKMERTEDYHQEIEKQLKHYEDQLENIPKYLSSKLQEQSEKKIIQNISMVEEKKIEKPKEISEKNQPEQKPKRLIYGPANDDLFSDSDDEFSEKQSLRRIVGFKQSGQSSTDASQEIPRSHKESKLDMKMFDVSNESENHKKKKRIESSGGGANLMLSESLLSSYAPPQEKEYYSNQLPFDSNMRGLDGSGNKKVKRGQTRMPLSDGKSDKMRLESRRVEYFYSDLM